MGRKSLFPILKRANRNFNRHERLPHQDKHSERKYKHLISKMREGVLFLDPATGRVLDSNPALLRMFGYSKDRLLKLRGSDLHPIQTLDIIETAYQERPRGGTKLLSDIPCQKADGQVFYTDIQLVGFKSASEDSIQAIFTDVTERKAQMEQLRERLAEKEILAEAQAQLMISMDHEGRILSLNRSAIDALGYEKSWFVNQELMTLISPERKEAVEAMLARSFSGESIRGFETELVKKNAQTITLSFDLIPNQIEGSEKVKHIVAVGSDTTGQNKLIRELTAAKKEVEELYEELRDAYRELKDTQDELVRQEKLTATGELAAGVAHEIRNPLSIINMSVQYLHSKLAPEDPLREFTEAVLEKVNRLDRITKELVQYGRPREPELHTADLHRVIDSTLRLASARSRAQRVVIHRNFSRFLPPVKVDVERMDEVFSNLITNALDVMTDGGELTVTTKEDLEERQVVIEVANTGKGIPPGKRAHLFTPFFTTKPDGTGLGLAICQRILSQHHGTITVDSKISGKHKGTRFIIALPIDPETKAPSGTKETEEPLTLEKSS